MWALGVIAAQALSGKLLDPRKVHTREELLDLLDQGDPSVVDLIISCLAPAEDRPSAVEVKLLAMKLAFDLAEISVQKEIADVLDPIDAVFQQVSLSQGEPATYGLATLQESTSATLRETEPSTVGEPELHLIDTDPQSPWCRVTGHFPNPVELLLTPSQLREMLQALNIEDWPLTFHSDDNQQHFIEVWRIEDSYTVVFSFRGTENRFWAFTSRLELVQEAIWSWITGRTSWVASLSWEPARKEDPSANGRFFHSAGANLSSRVRAFGAVDSETLVDWRRAMSVKLEKANDDLSWWNPFRDKEVSREHQLKVVALLGEGKSQLGATLDTLLRNIARYCSDFEIDMAIVDEVLASRFLIEPDVTGRGLGPLPTKWESRANG